MQTLADLAFRHAIYQQMDNDAAMHPNLTDIHAGHICPLKVGQFFPADAPLGQFVQISNVRGILQPLVTRCQG